MFEVLTLPPRLVAQAVEDLHSLATTLRRLTEDEGDLALLREAASKLPEVEDELTAGVTSLHREVKPLGKKVGDLDATAADLDGDLARLDGHVVGLDGNLQALDSNLQGLDRNLVGLDGTAEGLASSMGHLNEQVAVLITEIQGFRSDIAELRDKIPGL